MNPREYRKKAMKMRTLAVEQTRPEVRDSYQAVANVYDGLAHALETLAAIQHESDSMSLPAKTYTFRPLRPGRH